MPADMKSPDSKVRFEQLLPFYVTDRLSEADKAFVNAYMIAHADAKKAVQFTQKLSHVVRSTGNNRNPEPALQKLLGNHKSLQRLSPFKRMIAKLRSLGIPLPLAIVLLLLIGQGVGYTAHKMKWFTEKSTSIQTDSDKASLSVTLKKGSELAAAAVIIEKFGGQILQSSGVSRAGEIIINILDKTKIQALIDALMDAGLIETAAILL